MKLALIGNCAYQALLDDHAGVQWLCWPRFDSSFVFGGLVDSELGGEFSITPRDADYATKQDYFPNTCILRTEFRTPNGEFEVVDLAPRYQQYDRYFKPTMLVRRIRRLSGSPVMRVRCEPVYDYGKFRPKGQAASNHIYWTIDGTELRLTTNISLTSVLESRPFALEHEVYLLLAWGRPLEAPLEETCDSFLDRTKRYWERWAKHGALPDRFQEQVIRSAIVLKLHQFEDTGAITAATTSSIPEYPGSGRNWDYRYCWLRDACFSLGALRRLGQYEEMEGFVTYLKNLAESYPYLQPVYGISGESDLGEKTLDHLSGFHGHRPVRLGNHGHALQQHDVYGEMIAAIAPLFLDLRFRDLGTPTRLLGRLLDRIEQRMEQPDAGLWEKRQPARLHTFSLLMHWVGGQAAARIGDQLGDEDLGRRGRALSERARSIIDEACWRPELGFYADSVGTDNADASLLMMVNLGFLPPDQPRSLSHVNSLAGKLRARGHLLRRYVHHDGLGDTKASFTICGFWYAEALARLGRLEQAEEVFRQLVSHANHVGLLSEDIDPVTGKQWGNFPQTYSHVGLINAAFAISPIAAPIV